MSSPARRATFSNAALILLGVALGLAAAWFLARLTHERQGYADLDRYTHHLMSVAADLALESDSTIAAVLHDGKPVCSDADLAFMRDRVYGSRHVRDIARIADGFLLCSTGVGRLSQPRKLPPPDIDYNGMLIYAHERLLISSWSKGLIVLFHGVSVVFNPDLYTNLDEPPLAYTAYLRDPKKKRLVRGFGRELPLSYDEVAAGKLVRKNNMLYRVLCDPNSTICVVGSESYAAMMARSYSSLSYLFVAGGLLGGAFALIAVLSYRTRQSLEQQLRRAIRNEELTVQYQPIFDLRTSELVHCEALVRWTNEDGAAVGPEYFIALAEEKGFLSEITRLVLKTAVQELGDVLRERRFTVSVNMAAQDLHDPTFPSYLETLLAEANLPASSIGLELTERSTADQDKAITAIAALQASGHTVYIDDFGTGYSSLAYLHRLQAHAIKIDRAFTRTLGTEAVTASVIPQILAMARELNLLVVVEGIETREQAEYFTSATTLRVLGQGFYFSKPLFAEQLRKLVHT